MSTKHTQQNMACAYTEGKSPYGRWDCLCADCRYRIMQDPQDHKKQLFPYIPHLGKLCGRDIFQIICSLMQKNDPTKLTDFVKILNILSHNKWFLHKHPKFKDMAFAKLQDLRISQDHPVNQLALKVYSEHFEDFDTEILWCQHSSSYPECKQSLEIALDPVMLPELVNITADYLTL